MEVIKTLFNDGNKVVKSISVKEIIIPTIAFIILSTPYFDNLLRKISERDAVVLLIKIVIFVLVLAIMQFAMLKNTNS